MLIDWFTVCAQALNFIILVWLMKRFLYKPILHAIDDRENRIAAELAEAAVNTREAQRARADFQHRNKEFDQQRAILLSRATDEANAERQRLLDEAREASDALNARRKETLMNEAHELSQAIGLQMREEVFAVARKTLTDLATTGLEERMVDVFTHRLRAMDREAKARLGAAWKTATAPALVRSAFELPMPQRMQIQNALQETFSCDLELRFETAPDLIGGIELATNGQKLAWSIDHYLAALEKSVAMLVDTGAQPSDEINPAPVSAP